MPGSPGAIGTAPGTIQHRKARAFDFCGPQFVPWCWQVCTANQGPKTGCEGSACGFSRRRGVEALDRSQALPET
eukprot:3197289-Pyramimonas_sp.AAC.1